MNDRDTEAREATISIPLGGEVAVVPPQAPEPRRVDAEAALDPAGAERTESGLSERDLDILDFERQWWRHAGAKERAVRDRFGCTPTRYYQALNALLDRPEALEHDPMLVSRLRRLRTARQQARSAVRRHGG
ncbi:DUF3263 domain-containing protein [Yinghuangia seranimata]|uniref:DUF3263 domain-containing protein n=1 Tax=Yinghuangia seranimata TaxID=408067 RepID=UPI0031BA9F7C